MENTIEITQDCIRFIQVIEEKVVAIESFPVTTDDPIAAIPHMPLPSNLGKVRVVLHHSDTLTKFISQPPCDDERLEKLILFEVKNLLGESYDDSFVSWRISKTGGLGDMRILLFILKKKLVDSIENAFSTHGGKVVSISPPQIGLADITSKLIPNPEEDDEKQIIIADVADTLTHFAFIESNDLLYYRTIPNNKDESIIKSFADKRSIDIQTAKTILQNTIETPDDLKEIITRHSNAFTTLVKNNIRFVNSQTGVNFDPSEIYISGEGANVSGFMENISKGLKKINSKRIMKTKTINPWAVGIPALSSEKMDEISILPSPWTISYGTAIAETISLDGLQQKHREKKEYWLTTALLRLAVVASFIFLIIAIVVQYKANSFLNSQMKEANGIVNLAKKATEKQAKLKNKLKDFNDISEKQAFIADIAFPEKVSKEFMSLIAEIQDPNETPILLESFSVSPVSSGVLVKIFGRSTVIGTDVLNNFEKKLKSSYPAIKSIGNLQTKKTMSGLTFGYEVLITD